MEDRTRRGCRRGLGCEVVSRGRWLRLTEAGAVVVAGTAASRQLARLAVVTHETLQPRAANRAADAEPHRAPVDRVLYPAAVFIHFALVDAG